MRALVDVGEFSTMASALRSNRDRAEFLTGFLSGVAGKSWDDGTRIFSDAQALGIAAIGEARKRGVSE